MLQGSAHSHYRLDEHQGADTRSTQVLSNSFAPRFPASIRRPFDIAADHALDCSAAVALRRGRLVRSVASGLAAQIHAAVVADRMASPPLALITLAMMSAWAFRWTAMPLSLCC